MAYRTYPLDKLRSLIAYDPDSGVLTYIRDGRPCESIGAYGYVVLSLPGDRVTWKAHRVAWALHYGAWPTSALDHIDRDRTNNRISNLREATPSENALNSGHVDSSRGYQKFRDRWRLWLTRDNKSITRVYRTEEEAKAAVAYFREHGELLPGSPRGRPRKVSA